MPHKARQDILPEVTAYTNNENSVPIPHGYGFFMPTKQVQLLAPAPPKAAPDLRDLHKLLTWNDIFRPIPSKQLLISLLQQVGKYRALRLLTALGTIAFRTNDVSIATQVTLINEFASKAAYRAAVLDLTVQEERVTFAQDPLAVLASYVLQHGAEIEPDESIVLDSFFRSVLLVNELYGQDQIAAQQSLSQTTDSLLVFELRAAAIDDDPMDHLIARLWRFVSWARLEPAASGDYCDIDGALRQSYANLSYEQLATAGFAIGHYFRSIDSAQKVGGIDPILSVELLAAPLSDGSAIRTFARSIASNAKEISAELGARDRMTTAALLPLQKRPLVTVQDGVYACPVYSFLASAIGMGLFHRLAEFFGAKGKRPRFQHFFGRFLQHHTEEMLRIAISKTGVSVYSEFKYNAGSHKKQRSTSDVILIDRQTAIFFDVCNKRLKAEASLYAGNVNELRLDIDAMIIDQAKQLQGRIDDFKAGYYDIGPYSTADIDMIIPVAVTHQSIHGWVATRRYIDRRLNERGYLQEGPRLEVVSITELETLVQAFDGSLNFVKLLQERSSHLDEVARSRSLKNYLLLNHGWDGKDKRSMPYYTEWFDTVLTPTLQSWGIVFEQAASQIAGTVETPDPP